MSQRKLELPDKFTSSQPQEQAASIMYIVLVVLANILAGVSIVIVNKAVFSPQYAGFNHPIALTFIHATFTWVYTLGGALLGFYETKDIPWRTLLPLSLANVGYIGLSNLSLQVNSVGLAQVMKIAVVPTVIGLELLMFRKVPSVTVGMAVVMCCIGVALATIQQDATITGITGLLVGLGATTATALYNIYAGSMQRELRVSSSQLMQAYLPQAVVMLMALVPILEPMGSLPDPKPSSLLGYQWTASSALLVFVSAILGVAVSLSTFLVLGVTSTLTYNVLGQLKTVIIIAMGAVLFGEHVAWQRVLGTTIAMAGVLWYTMAVNSASSSQQSVAVYSAPLVLPDQERANVGMAKRERSSVGGAQHESELLLQQQQAVPDQQPDSAIGAATTITVLSSRHRT